MVERAAADGSGPPAGTRALGLVRRGAWAELAAVPTRQLASIEHVAPRGLVVNLATDGRDELVSFRASRFDRAPGASTYTFNLFDELRGTDAAGDLARLVSLLEQRRLTSAVELEAEWWDVGRAIEALLARAISGKVVLRIS